MKTPPAWGSLGASGLGSPEGGGGLLASEATPLVANTRAARHQVMPGRFTVDQEPSPPLYELPPSYELDEPPPS